MTVPVMGKQLQKLNPHNNIRFLCGLTTEPLKGRHNFKVGNVNTINYFSVPTLHL